MDLKKVTAAHSLRAHGLWSIAPRVFGLLLRINFNDVVDKQLGW
jgi:hypothetical protein